ncbi:hypothetical protein LTS08_001584 [Lithohypha guttulata]|uniref:uncharacterized protein n=1 Tax=Lithohypha guttulata TaxID=1690604 RepID=UPI002DE12B56|nr:hypothetical protein LTR51_003748 [Lithohypha guttulata]KAK5105307.1 hypothetical protein LTS08_001584 [Lithohypha guttulata]
MVSHYRSNGVLNKLNSLSLRAARPIKPAPIIPIPVATGAAALEATEDAAEEAAEDAFPPALEADEAALEAAEEAREETLDAAEAADDMAELAEELMLDAAELAALDALLIRDSAELERLAAEEESVTVASWLERLATADEETEANDEATEEPALLAEA